MESRLALNRNEDHPRVPGAYSVCITSLPVSKAISLGGRFRPSVVFHTPSAITTGDVCSRSSDRCPDAALRPPYLWDHRNDLADPYSTRMSFTATFCLPLPVQRPGSRIASVISLDTLSVSDTGRTRRFYSFILILNPFGGCHLNNSRH